MGAAMNTGIWLANPMAPSSSDDPVSRYTSHDWATFCIHVPIREMSWPLKNSWKFRCFSARNVVCRRLALAAGGGGFTGLELMDRLIVEEECAMPARPNQGRAPCDRDIRSERLR